jgi:hypothetical protein
MSRGHRKLTDEQIVEILLTTTSDSLASRLYGVSRQAVNNIRTGKSFSEIRPDIPRRKIQVKVKQLEVSCLKCAYWDQDRCSFGFPDPASEGVQAAEDCAMYQL